MKQEQFYALCSDLFGTLKSSEVLLCNYYGEDSDFVRLNNNRVRQAGRVRQGHVDLTLIKQGRQLQIEGEMSGHSDEDQRRLRHLLQRLRNDIDLLPVDPYLLYADSVNNSSYQKRHPLPDSAEMVDTLISQGQGMDLVGIFANGNQTYGFANSLGQRNWHESNSFNLDWSCYLQKDKAVKQSYAGHTWNEETLKEKLTQQKQQLQHMARPARSLQPGSYRAYLAPAALEELINMLGWGGFGLKSQRTRQSPLMKLIRGEKKLSDKVNLQEDYTRGLTPRFTHEGFITDEGVSLINQGKHHESLVAPRSAREFDQKVNSAGEAPYSLEMSAGTLKQKDILSTLDTGLYINNLWYCNYSDRNDCRITGMTRFACFWVENGEIVAPVNVMRFDDSIYHLLGDQLEALTLERELQLDNGSYGQRANRSALLPGVVIANLNLTL